MKMMQFTRTFMQRNKKQFVGQSFSRLKSSDFFSKSIVHLKQRKLLHISGPDASDFLQGLMTNDIRHLEDGSKSIYSLFLNIKGRILFDSIIYKCQEKDAFYIECDSTLFNNFIKHLKMYKLKRKVNILPMNNDMKVWCIYENKVDDQVSYNNIDNPKISEENISACSISNNTNGIIDNIAVYQDPRLFELGYRVLTKSVVDSDDINKYLDLNIKLHEIIDYISFRYKLGVPEGVRNFPIGVSFPLESNCDYLHGVSFQKGCYIGQELTARTYHTGVVRKRIMPLILDNGCTEKFQSYENITNESGQIIGKIIDHEGNYGLGLMRISEASASSIINISNCTMKLMKPQWWPQDKPKIESSLKNKN
ncbi:putative transferase CAF17, mitochondrial [Trichogramma pretiosum]|uniref:putative transferase CAF17, mitochondrial n=1 Tax=Trichogramma pretiosum TaxID=7493 RepID=UPI0006C985DB|nr:putative transferase CAF17, mitochondrial [Trichogramma pretiosum]